MTIQQLAKSYYQWRNYNFEKFCKSPDYVSFEAYLDYILELEKERQADA